jgi:ParB family chromosome partitioning protein
MTDYQVQMIPLDQLHESPDNTRRRYNEKKMLELVESVRSNGVLVPLIVREMHDGDDVVLGYEIIAGSRRFRAAQAAEKEKIPAVIRDVTDEEALEINIYENDQREDVHPLEQAAGYQKLLQRPGYDMAALCAKFSRSETFFYKRLQLLKMIQSAQDRFLEDEITLGHAEAIARLQPKDQIEALKQCFDIRWINGKNVPVLCSVKEIESWIQREILLDLHAAPFSKTDDIIEKACPCVTCHKRTGFTPALFDDIAKKDTCTDPSCYHAKLQKHIELKKAEAQESEEKLLNLATRSWTSGNEDKKIPDLLLLDKWREVKKKDKCEFVKKGIVVAGDRDLGKVLQVCTNTKCKTHFGNAITYNVDPKEKERLRKEKLQKQLAKIVNDRVLSEVIARVPRDFDRSDFELIAGILASRHNDEALKPICDRYNWGPGKNDWGQTAWEPSVIANLSLLSDHELLKMIIELCLLIRPVQLDSDVKRLHSAADRYGVDVKAVEKAVSFEFNKKSKPAESETKAKKSETKAPKPETKTKKRATKKVKK